MKRRDDARAIRAMLQDRLTELLARILPGGRVDGGLYIVRNPTRDDRSAGSFIVWLRGDARGGFKDYASDDKGDVIDLIGYVHRRPKGDRKFALDFARDFLGLRTMDPAVLAAASAAAKAKAAAAARQSKEDALKKRMRAFEIFERAQPIAGSPALAYFEARRCPLQLVQHREDDLRFAPALEYWRGAQWDGARKIAPGPKFPAVVAAIRNAESVLIAVHCTFLDRDCGAKAPVENAKLMYGAVAGGVVRLTRGDSGQSVEEAALSGRRDVVVIAEGIETGLSVAIAAPEARVWAATSLANIRNVPVNMACVGSVIVAADNPNPDASPAGRVQAAEALEAAIEALRGHGIRVGVMQPHEGGDFNDLIRW